jgi:hypothetical protein
LERFKRVDPVLAITDEKAGGRAEAVKMHLFHRNPLLS